jgi:uncharacterized protein YbaP (TraB family)
MYFEIQGTNFRLAGSMHLVPAGGTVPQWVASAFDWSEDIYLEGDVADLPKHAFLPIGESSESRLTPAVWAAIRAGWPANHPSGPLDRQKPWFIAMVLGTTGIQFSHGVEPLITQRAKNDGRTIGYLEGIGEFAGLLDGVPHAVYEQSIPSVLNTPAAARAVIVANIYKAWLSADAEAVTTAMLASPLNQFPAMRSAILDARNALWLPRIIEIKNSPKRTLIFVGAGHLGGANGLLAMLARAGYQLTSLLR